MAPHTPILSFVATVAISIAVSLMPWSEAFSQTRPNVAVLELSGSGVPSVELEGLTNRLRAEVFETGGFTVVERGQVEAILREQGFQQTGCTDASCAVEIGRLLNVEFMIVGSVDKVGDVYTVNVRQVSVESGEVARNTKTDCIACTLNEVVLKAIRIAARQLAGLDSLTQRTVQGTATVLAETPKPPPAGNALRILVSGRNPVLFIDGNRQGQGKGVKLVDSLSPGKHTVMVDRGVAGREEKRVKVKSDRLVKVRMLDRAADIGVGGVLVVSGRASTEMPHLAHVTGTDTIDGPAIRGDPLQRVHPAPALTIGGRARSNVFDVTLFFGIPYSKTNTRLDSVTVFEYTLSSFALGGFLRYYRTVFTWDRFLRIEPGLQAGLIYSGPYAEGAIRRSGSTSDSSWVVTNRGDVSGYTLDYRRSQGDMFGIGGPCLRISGGYRPVHLYIDYAILLGWHKAERGNVVMSTQVLGAGIILTP